ncbi:MAG: hypothetical protein MI700_01570 [Balneolales bacterium]|nr:hypothetical protein [Balneolales bacterium]
MKSVLYILFMIAVSVPAYAQYESSAENPYGKLNPDAPKEVADFAPLIGVSSCSTVARAQDGTWNEPGEMTWKWQYVLNGQAVQDETFTNNGVHAGSIRQFNADSAAWYVHYYSSGSVPSILPAWKGEKNEDGDIILYREQQAPNGMDGFYKINFTDITDSSFEWLGEWVNPDESIKYPVWKISCTKTES